MSVYKWVWPFALAILSTPAGARQECEAVFAARTVALVQGKKSQSAPLYERIDSGNLLKLFTHEYETGRFGAKAVAFRDEHGIQVAFFPTGVGREGNNVHHRDVFSAMQLKASDVFGEELDAIIYQALLFFEETGVKKVNELNLGERDLVDRVLAVSAGVTAAFKKASADFKQRQIDRELGSSPVVRQLLAHAQGYQFTAEMKKGRLVITRMEVSSSLTKIQAESEVALDRAEQEEILAEVLNRIDPAIRAFREPAWAYGLTFK